MTKLTLQKVFYIRWQYIKTQNKIPSLKTLIAMLSTNETKWNSSLRTENSLKMQNYIMYCHLCIVSGLFKAGLRQPRVSVKFDYSSEGFKRKFSSNIFACNLIIEWPRKEWGNFNLKDF